MSKKSCDTASLKGQSNKILDHQFFHNSNQLGPLTNGLKYLRFWLSFRWVILIFVADSLGYYTPGSIDSPRYATPGRFDESFGSMTPRGMIPRQDWLCAVWYPGELDLPGYHTPGSHIWRVFYWLAGVWYHSKWIKNVPKLDSPGYDTPASYAFIRRF